MRADELRAIQRPIKERYREDGNNRAHIGQGLFTATTGKLAGFPFYGASARWLGGLQLYFDLNVQYWSGRVRWCG